MSDEFHNKKKSRKCSRDAVGSCDLEKEPSTDHCIYREKLARKLLALAI